MRHLDSAPRQGKQDWQYFDTILFDNTGTNRCRQPVYDPFRSRNSIPARVQITMWFPTPSLPSHGSQLIFGGWNCGSSRVGLLYGPRLLGNGILHIHQPISACHLLRTAARITTRLDMGFRRPMFQDPCVQRFAIDVG